MSFKKAYGRVTFTMLSSRQHQPSGGLEMTSFQVSPPRVEKVVKEDQPVFFQLGAFSPAPKLHFGTVTVGESKRRTLIIRNPLDSACFMRFVKRPSDKFALVGYPEGDDLFIPSKNKVELTVEWRPNVAGSVFDAYHVKPTIGGPKFSVQLLGACQAAPLKHGAQWRSHPSRYPNAEPRKPKDLGLGPSGVSPVVQPVPKLTIPRSPKFSKRFSPRYAKRNGIGDCKVPESPPQNLSPLSPSSIEKLDSSPVPFSPEGSLANITELKFKMLEFMAEEAVIHTLDTMKDVLKTTEIAEEKIHLDVPNVENFAEERAEAISLDTYVYPC